MKHKGKEIPTKDIDCEEAISRLMDYLDNYLKNNRKNELQKHLATCSSCMDRYEFQKMLKEKISRLAYQSDPILTNGIKILLGSPPVS